MRIVFLFLIYLSLTGIGFCTSRIVSLSPALTETLVYVGAADKVVGVTVFTNLIPEARRVGGIVNPNVEKIISLHPDLILATTMTSDRVISILKRYTNVEVFSLTTLEDIEKSIERIANLTSGRGKVKRQMFVSDLKYTLKRLSCLENKRIAILTSHPPPVIAGRDSYIGEALGKAGAIVVTQRTFSVISVESLLKRNPELLVTPCGTEVPPILKNIPGVCIEKEKLLHPSPRFLEALKELGRKLCNH